MTDNTQDLGNGVTPQRRPDPAARRAQLDALRATSSTSGAGFAAGPRRRHHAALASRVLATGLAAGTAVGLIGVLANADQASAGATTATTAPILAPDPTTSSTAVATTTAPPTTAAPTTAVPATPVPAPAPTNAPAPQQAPQPQRQQAPQPQPTAAPVTAPPVTAPPVTAPPAPPVTAPPVTAPPATTTGAS